MHHRGKIYNYDFEMNPYCFEQQIKYTQPALSVTIFGLISILAV